MLPLYDVSRRYVGPPPRVPDPEPAPGVWMVDAQCVRSFPNLPLIKDWTFPVKFPKGGPVTSKHIVPVDFPTEAPPPRGSGSGPPIARAGRAGGGRGQPLPEHGPGRLEFLSALRVFRSELVLHGHICAQGT
jgi:hypothetical protein